MATQIPERIIRVRPQVVTTKNRGHMQESGDEIFQLSDTGHQIISMWVWLVDIFELPEDADRSRITDNLVQGLEKALGDHPELTGTMHFDNEARRIVIKRTQDASVALHIKDATAAEDQIPSFAWYHAHDHPVHRLEVAQLIPAAAGSLPMVVAQDLAAPGPVVAALQATFIRGGVIVGSAISHQVSDGLGCDAFLATWAAYARAAATGEPPRLAADVPPHTLFTAARRPSPAEWAALQGRYPTMKPNTAPPSPPADPAPPVVVKTRVFHFPRSRLAALKAECSAGLPEADEDGEGGDGGDGAVSFISTYDAVAALWWRALLRAKRPLLGFGDDDATRAIHAVNLRRRAGGDDAAAASPRFIGSSVALPRSAPVSVGRALGPRAAALPLLARAVRGATRQVTPAYARGQVAWAAGAPDLRYSELDMPWVLGRDCLGFGWHDMTAYAAHDFGFGTPAALRWPQMGFEGFFFMLPSRASVRGMGPDEGVEVTFGMEESCFARLEKDEELLAYCEQRGLGS